MVFSIFIIILPLFAAMSAGFGLSKLFKIDEHSLTRVLTDVFMPALVFYSLYESDVVFTETIKLAGATTTAVFLLMGMALIYSRMAKISSAEFAPPVCFMNSGFIGIPLMALWGGAAAVNVDVIIDQVQTFYLFTIGIIIVSGGFNSSGLKEMVKTPLLWAIFAGFILKFSGIVIPVPIIDIFKFCGEGASALAAFTVGASMVRRRIVFNKHLFAAVVLRFIGGFLAGWGASVVFRLSGDTKIIMIVATSLPSAVFSYVLPLRYGVDTELAGSVVVVSTILGIVLIPVSFVLASAV